MQVGGAMQAGTGSGEEAIADSDTEGTARVHLGIEPFAVIHDEPYLTIVYSDGEFKGEIVDANIERINHAMKVVEEYNLAIARVEYTDSSLVRLYLIEKGGQCP